MEMEDDQQQQRPRIHSSIREGIARLADRRYRDERHKLHVDGSNTVGVMMDRRSLQHLVHFLDNDDSHEVTITELMLDHVSLLHPSDGGLEILRSFFARSDTTLTKVTLEYCSFGETEDASQLLMAFQTNTTVTDLIVRLDHYLNGAVLGNCLSTLTQSMPQLQRLYCYCILRVTGILAFQPALQANRTLKELDLPSCFLEDDGIRIIADSLVGNTTIEALDISHNDITYVGLADITRLVVASQLKRIGLSDNHDIFNDESSTLRFARVLSRHEFLKELDLSHCRLGDKGIRIVAEALVGNTTMEILVIKWNRFTSVGLADITRLLVSTQLKTIGFWRSGDELFDAEDATQRFVTTLQHQKSTVQELTEIGENEFPEGISSETYTRIKRSLTRNQQLNCVNLLLAPPLQPPQQQRNAGTMMLKISHKAITKFAMVPDNAGASAIFKLFQVRPQLLEKRLKRPAVAVAVSQEQKRRRL